jgi:hypothetical protein
VLAFSGSVQAQGTFRSTIFRGSIPSRRFRSIWIPS